MRYDNERHKYNELTLNTYTLTNIEKLTSNITIGQTLNQIIKLTLNSYTVKQLNYKHADQHAHIYKK